MKRLIYFPWQSWSPYKPNPFGIPLRDYPPVPQTAPENKPSNFKLKTPISGWCSWYAFGKNISETKLLGQAKRIKQSGLDAEYFLIDDGWCCCGDWMNPNKKKFPNLVGFVHKLTVLGFKPGLWIAPFLVDRHSEIVQKHPDWLVTNKNGQPVSGLGISPLDRFLPWCKYILDFSHPEAKKYIYGCLDYLITKSKTSLLKLDFLYAPYFQPGLDNDKLPNQYLLDLFSYLKTKYPDVYTIACGCPYKPARFMVDAIRISKDISLPQLNYFPLLNYLVRHFRFRLLKKNHRVLSNQKKYFYLDPDVYLSGLPQEFYRQTDFGIFFSGNRL